MVAAEEKQPEQCDAPQPSRVLAANVIPIPSGEVIAYYCDETSLSQVSFHTRYVCCDIVRGNASLT